jgi:glycosyltransferase involved in cell wall biosynthesis
MLQPPKVSVRVLSYNHAQYLPAALDSVLGQTFRDFEIVLVDDGSRDGSLEIAESYAARYPSVIRVLKHPNHENRGISATANLAIANSRGLYWSGLASDDCWHPNKLAQEVEFMENNPHVGFVYSRAQQMDEAGRALPVIFGTDISRDPCPMERLIQENVIPAITVLVRREEMERVGPHDETLVYSDWEIWIRLLAHTKVGFLPDPLALHRVHTYNTSIGIEPAANLQHRREVLLALRRKAPSIGGALAAPRLQALLDLQLSYLFFCGGSPREAAQHFGSAFDTDETLRGDTDYIARWLRARIYDSVSLSRYHDTALDFISWAPSQLPARVEKVIAARLAKRITALEVAQAVLENRGTDVRKTRDMAFNCLKKDPFLLGDPKLRLLFMEAIIGAGAVSRMRRLKNALSL